MGLVIVPWNRGHYILYICMIVFLRLVSTTFWAPVYQFLLHLIYHFGDQHFETMMITRFAIFLNSVGPLVWIMQVPFLRISFLVTTRVLRISLPHWIPISHLNSNVALLLARFPAILFRVWSWFRRWILFRNHSLSSGGWSWISVGYWDVDQRYYPWLGLFITTVFPCLSNDWYNCRPRLLTVQAWRNTGLSPISIRSIWLPFVRISMERWTLFWCCFAYGPQYCCYGMSTFHFCCMSYALTGWMFCGQLPRPFYWHFFARQSLPWLWYLWFTFTWFRIARISFEGLSAVSGTSLFGCRSQFSCFNSLSDTRTAARTRDFVASMDHPVIGYEIRAAIISSKAVICYQVCSATSEAQSLSH